MGATRAWSDQGLGVTRAWERPGDGSDQGMEATRAWERPGHGTDWGMYRLGNGPTGKRSVRQLLLRMQRIADGRSDEASTLRDSVWECWVSL